MKKIFTTFLFIFTLSIGSLVSAQVTRGTAPSWTGGDPGLRTVGSAATSKGMVFKAFYNSLDANYSTNDAPILYVEYGTTGQLGNATEGRYQAVGNRIEEFTVSGLDPKQTYYYRAVLMYNNKTAYGEVLEYRQQTTSPVNNTTNQTTTATVTDEEVISDPSVPKDIWPWSLFSWFGGGSKKNTVTKPSSKKENGVSISLSNNVTSTGLGQNVTYTIDYANTSGKTFSDVDIELLLPLEYAFVSSDKGDYYKDSHSVLLKLYSFEPKEHGTIQVVAQAVSKKSQKLAEASAHLYTEKTETVVYDIDNYTATVAAANRSARNLGKNSTQRNTATAANPLAGSTMIGWLIIALIIAGVVFVSYKYFKKDKY